MSAHKGDIDVVTGVATTGHIAFHWRIESAACGHGHIHANTHARRIVEQFTAGCARRTICRDGRVGLRGGPG